MKTGTSSSLQSDQRVVIRIVISTVVIIVVTMLLSLLTFLTIKMTMTLMKMMTTHNGDDSLNDNENDDDIENDYDGHDDDDMYLRRQRRVRLLTSGGHRLPTLKTGSEIFIIIFNNYLINIQQRGPPPPNPQDWL